MTDDELAEARDHVWEALRSSPIRRAILGRERCDALVRVTLNAMPPEAELCAAAASPGYRSFLCERLERRVRANYSENCGFAFVTMILVWAISAIVKALVIRWIERRLSPKPEPTT